MAYITVSNFKKILLKLDLENLENVTDKLYKKDIYFFSKKEKAFLLGFRELLINPEKFASSYYKKVEIQDSYKYLHPEKKTIISY